MGQNEICKLLKKKPNLTTREIAEELSQSIFTISKQVNKMLGRDLDAVVLRGNDRKKIEEKYPTMIRSATIKIYLLKDDK